MMAQREDPHVIRIGDIHAAQQLPSDWRTDELYLPTNKTIGEMTQNELRRGMCYKSGGSTDVCHRCPAPCSIGRRLVEMGAET